MNERQLTQEEFAAIWKSAFPLSAGELSDEQREFELATNPMTLEDVRDLIAAALTYADQRREGERCKWKDSGDTNAIGLSFYEVGCGNRSIKIGEFCPQCGKRIEVTP